MRWGQKGRRCRWIIHLIRRGQKKLSLSAINYGLCESAGICDCSGSVSASYSFIHPATTTRPRSNSSRDLRESMIGHYFSIK